jgi:HK97 family phage major capsid protein
VNVATIGSYTATTDTLAYNDILALFHAVDPAYRNTPDVAFMFADATLLAIRKLTDSNNRPLFIAGGVSEGIQNAQPDTILGKRYWINQDMNSIGSGSVCMAFGPWHKYKIRRVKTIQLARLTERFIDKLQYGFLAYQRFDGNLVDAGTHPLQLLSSVS